MNVTVPNRLQMMSSGRGRNAILVTSTQPISVAAYNRAGTSCGGFLVLPVTGLGRAYHVIGWNDPSEFVQMGVAALNDNTTVHVTFAPEPQLEVLFEGVRYRQRDTLTVTLDAHETLQIQEFNGNDISGTRVISNQPVAVFSGNFHTGLNHKPFSYFSKVIRLSF